MQALTHLQGLGSAYERLLVPLVLSKENVHIEREMMIVWSDPKHQGSGLLCEERESRENYAENGEETLAAKVLISL